MRISSVASALATVAVAGFRLTNELIDARTTAAHAGLRSKSSADLVSATNRWWTRGIRFSYVTATDLAYVGEEEAGGSGFAHWVAVRRGILVLYFISLGVWSAHYGIPVQRELVIAWVCGALACASLGRPWREALRLVRDWVPMMILLSAYDFTRGAADSLGIGVHVHPMIDFDRFLFFGTTPTQWLQAHVNDPKAVNWLDVAFTLTYTSFFIVPFTVAGFLWARDRLEFLRFSRRILTLFAAGLATYVAFPAAPPWMAADMGLLHGVARTTPDGWQVIGGRTVELFDEGQASVNLVAAVPSLHSAVTMLVVLFLWPRVRRPLRPLLLLYPLAMGLSLMGTGEHYFFDVLLGWMYAGGVMGAWAWWERRRERIALRGRSRPRPQRLAAGNPEARVQEEERRHLAEEPA
jgi:membrane-associated phospholipid phosphatase